MVSYLPQICRHPKHRFFKNGLLSGAKPLPDATAQTFILKGVPGKMPAFGYGLEPAEVDAIITYLKTMPADGLKTRLYKSGEGGNGESSEAPVE